MVGILRNEMEIYLDNIMIFSEILEEYILRLDRVLKSLAEANALSNQRAANSSTIKPNNERD
jgi:hypothetical protein